MNGALMMATAPGAPTQEVADSNRRWRSCRPLLWSPPVPQLPDPSVAAWGKVHYHCDWQFDALGELHEAGGSTRTSAACGWSDKARERADHNESHECCAGRGSQVSRGPSPTRTPENLLERMICNAISRSTNPQEPVPYPAPGDYHRRSRRLPGRPASSRAGVSSAAWRRSGESRR